MRTILRAFMLALCLLSFQLAVFSQQVQVAKTIPNSDSPDGLIGFLEFRPSDYGSQKHPLIIFLHGIGERGNGTSQINSVTANGIPNYCSKGASMRFTVGGQTSSFVVLSPQLSSQYGYWPTYYVKEMIKYAKANLQIDPDRIYITGLSLGGGGVWRSITDAWGWDYTFDAGIAAAAPVCGTQEETDGDFCKTIGDNHLPVWAFHSMDDGTVGVGATQHAEILGINCGITPAIKLTYYQSGGHGGAWLNAYDTGHITRATVVNGNVTNFTANPNLYEWLLSNKRNTAAAAPAPPVYTAPVANAGAAQIITLPISTITLTGSGTGTNGATISSYSWTKTSGPSAGVISLPLLNTSIVTGLVQGTYVFTLTVTDNHGLTSSSSVTITVNSLVSIINQPPVANAGSSITITLPVTSTPLTGSGSYDPDGTIKAYNWYKITGPDSYNINNATSAKAEAASLSQGVYVFTLVVTDNNGATAYSSVSVTVNPASNQPPVANAGSNVTLTLPVNATTLNGSGSYDPNGTITSYNWYKISGYDNYKINSPNAAVTDVSNLIQGVYVFGLNVTDDKGTTSTGRVTVTVNPAVSVPTGTPSPTEQPIGYVKMSSSAFNACNDASTDGRIPVYGSSIANGSILYTDAAHTKPYNGGWNWFSSTASLGATVTQSFAIFPNGSVNLMYNCATLAPVTTPPVVTPPVVTPPVVTPPAPANNFLGYIRMQASAFYACGDPATDGRIPVYGNSIGNGAILYTDAALTQPVSGGWNWYGFSTTLDGVATQTFAVYPNGGIFFLKSCASNLFRTTEAASSKEELTTEQQNALLKHLKDSAASAITVLPYKQVRLNLYPNPVLTTATVELNSDDNSVKIVSLYSASGVLKAKYTWTATKGKNVFSLKNVAGLANGLYIIEIKDSNGLSNGKLKFIKM